MQVEITINNLDELQVYAQRLSNCVAAGDIIYLDGDLGAGKTTFCQAFFRCLGFNGLVKSPTYTLIESYFIQQQHYYHFDLYRLTDPLELDTLGIEDYFRPDSILLVEWPEKGGAILPKPTLRLRFEMLTDTARKITLQTEHSDRFGLLS